MGKYTQRYILIVAYDGTNYKGWQYQPNAPSIVQTLKNSFVQAFCSDSVSFLGASRTDAGVHAHGQVVRLMTDLILDPKKIVCVLNNALPRDILIRSAWSAQKTFHPLYGVCEKRYTYQIFTKRPSPFDARYGWYVVEWLDQVKLIKTLHVFIGTHDFRSFCKDTDASRSIRTIKTISCIKKENGYTIEVVGHSFAQHMIRRIIGAAVDVSRRPSLSIYDVQSTLLKKNTRQTLYCAPACGLFLSHIQYEGDVFKEKE